MNKKYASGIVVACLLLAAQWIFAEDQAPPPGQNAPRRILVALEKSWLSGYSSEEMVILQRSFMTVLSEAAGGPAPVSYGFLKGFPGSIKDRNKAARDAGADCWVLLRLSGFKGLLRSRSFPMTSSTTRSPSTSARPGTRPFPSWISPVNAGTI